MVHTFSKEALARPSQTLQAAGVLRGQIEAIHRAAEDAREDELVIAVVQDDLSFGGVWIVARDRLVQQLPLVEDQSGWSFTFPPGISLAQIEERCLEFTRVSLKRWQAMDHWANRQQ